MLLLQELEVKDCRHKTEVVTESFRGYITRVMPTYEFYDWNDRAIDLLQQVADGEIKRLIMTVPPQHGKTQLASRLFPAYFLHRSPRKFVGLTTYDGGISYGLSREARKFYRRGGGQLAPDSQNVGMWNTTEDGGLWAAGVGGAVTSRPAHLLVGDDWIKGQREADQPSVREDVRTFYSPTWRSRLQKGGVILIISTRWHHEDLIGQLLELEESSDEPENWTIVDLPAIAEPEHERPKYPETCIVLPDHRPPGTVLCPERFDLPELVKLKHTMQPRHWDALYQCRPSAVEGTIFRREWINWYDGLAKVPRLARRIISLDAAFRDRADSDYVAFTVWGQNGDDCYLLDAVNDRMDFNRTVETLLALTKQWEPSATLIEGAANGDAILSYLKKKARNLVRITPDGGKEARAFSTQPLFVQGFVHLPIEAPWLATYVKEVLAFPGGARNLVDSTTQALRWLHSIIPGEVTNVSWGYGSAAAAMTEPSPIWGWADDILEDPASAFPAPWEADDHDPYS
jgi:predicted phage terminase large subunit-like protein